MNGFVKDTVTLWENQYPCMRKDGIDTPLRLLYLVDENGQNGALYMLDLDDPEEIYPFVCMNYNQYKHTIGEETTSAEASTQEGETGLFQSTESQMRLILCAFVVVVLILLIIIVVLIVKRKKDDDDPYDDFYDDDDDDDEDYDDPDDEKLYETDDPDDTGISKRYGKETFRKKGGFMHKLLEGMEDDLDDNLEDDLDDPEEDTDDREKSGRSERTITGMQMMKISCCRKNWQKKFEAPCSEERRKQPKKIPMTISNLLICRIVTGGINFDSIYR